MVFLKRDFYVTYTAQTKDISNQNNRKPEILILLEHT